MLARSLVVLLTLAPLVTPAGAREDPLAVLRRGLGPRAATIATLSYRLTVTDGTGRVVRDVRDRLDAATGRLWREERPGGAVSWWDGEAGWRLEGGRLVSLGEEAARALRHAGAYNFVRLFRDPATRAEWIGERRIRVTPAAAAALELEIDGEGSGRVRETRFEDGAVGRELDHEGVDGLVWPMRFELVEGGRVVRTGRFAEVAFDDAPALRAATLPVEPSRALPAPVAGGAVLVGAGRLSTERNDYNLGVTGDGARLALARSDAEFRGARVLLARRGAGGFGDPAPAPFTHEGWKDSDPWLTPDGGWLYFTSDRPISGIGPPRRDLDLWRARIGGANPAPPEPLSAANGPANELGPEVHGGWLYFNSSRPGGPAKMSIYRVRLGPGGPLGAPEPLPAPFDEGVAQGDFTLSPDGRTAVFWSIRPEHPREGHLYAARRIGERWSAAVRLPAPFGSAGFDFTPQFSPDGKVLWFASTRRSAEVPLLNGQANLWAVGVAELERALDAALP